MYIERIGCISAGEEKGSDTYEFFKVTEEDKALHPKGTNWAGVIYQKMKMSYWNYGSGSGLPFCTDIRVTPYPGEADKFIGIAKIRYLP